VLVLFDNDLGVVVMAMPITMVLLDHNFAVSARAVPEKTGRALPTDAMAARTIASFFMDCLLLLTAWKRGTKKGCSRQKYERAFGR
jgi:hypothetical protein